MIVWRVSRHISIEGSTTPGRWNEKGIKVLYTSANPSLCSWEYFAHKVGPKEWPTDLQLLSLEVPDEFDDIQKVPTNKLPDGWNSLPYKRNVQKTAKHFIIDKNLLGTWVPSVVIPEDFNLILNPNYQNYSKLVKQKKIFPFDYDSRFKPFFEEEREG